MQLLRLQEAQQISSTLQNNCITPPIFLGENFLQCVVSEITRREVLKKAVRLVKTAAVVGTGYTLAGVAGKVFSSQPSSQEGKPVGQKSQPSSQQAPSPTIGEGSIKAVNVEISVDPKVVADLAVIWTAGRVRIEGPRKSPEEERKRKGVYEVLYRRRAEEVLKFAKVVGPELQKIRPQLSKVATFTDVGTVSPPMPDERLKANPEVGPFLPKDHFVSGHFGPREFRNLKYNRLTRLNLALILAIGMAELENDSRPFNRLVSADFLDRWDFINAHVGRDALRFLTGIKNSQVFVYGPDSRGGTFPTEETLYSNELDDKLVVMFAPGIMALRSYKAPSASGQVTDFEAVDATGNPDYVLVNHWNANSFLRAKYRQVYEGLVEFCTKHTDFNWLVTESIV